MNVVQYLARRLQRVISSNCALTDKPTWIDYDSNNIIYSGCVMSDRNILAKYVERSGLRDSGIVNAVTLENGVLYVSVCAETLLELYVLFKQMETA